MMFLMSFLDNNGLDIAAEKAVVNYSKFIYIYLTVVTYRNADTLVPIIEKHVAAGSVIYTDGWKVYFPLENTRFRWFNVIPARNYMQTYINEETRETHRVHKNKMDGKWGIS